tara:strand:- start:122822 stop:124462 length:1641 start_codon:yes stop_codon:yes gene_type:complete
MNYYNLGTYGRKITTGSAEAQLWFDRGLLWTYGYHHEEAIFCFEQALVHDADCAMAHWGIAYAIGPNYNKPWEAFEPDEKHTAVALARKSLESAVARVSDVSPAERALIEALVCRYPDNGDVEAYGPYNDAYAAAMRAVQGAFAEDPDILSLFAEALMNRTPWQLWDLPSGAVGEGADTLEAVGILEGAFRTLEGAWDHPGLLHMYVHLMEMSPFPERALPHGDRLSELVPDAGHLLHMATHIDVLCGDYENVVSRNTRAIRADKLYLQRNGPHNFYTLYRCHNYHFKIYGAMFLGQPKTALQAADELIENLSDDVVRPLADWFEGFISMKQHVLVRFGRWDAILQQPMPDDAQLYCVTTAMMHYARAVALANIGQLAAAELERHAFDAARARVPETRMLFNNSCRDILGVAEQMMLGELEYKKGNHEAAFAHLASSVSVDDGLPYDEPWGWIQPTRHALGALLLEQNRLNEAEAVYRADLGLDATLSRACQHPNNVWSLHGLHECLARRGETVERPHVKKQLDKALARAQIAIHASCFCRSRTAA